MSAKLKEFLETYRVKKSNPSEKLAFTHTGIGSYLGSYNIPEDKRNELHTLIVHSVFEKKSLVSLTEKLPSEKPFTVDCDLQYSQEYATRQHTADHVAALAKLYCNSIRKYVDIDNTVPIRVFSMERDGPYPNKGNIKDGIHLEIMVKTHTDIQHIIHNDVVKSVMKDVFSNKGIGELPLKNTADKIMDEAVIDRNNWTLYGCSKPNLGRYNVSHVYDHVYDDSNDTFELREVKNPMSHYTHLDLINQLSVNQPDAPTYKIKSEYGIDLSQLTDQNNDKKTKRKVADTRAFISGKRKPKKHISSDEAKKRVEEATALTKILAPYRADEYATWMEVGWCLYNISQSLLDVWIEFSKQSFKFKEGECEELWCKFTEHNLGTGSLHRWAKLDNPSAYIELRSEFISAYIFRSLSGTTQDAAEVVYQMFKHQYVCVSSKGDLWYEFKNHRWHECKNGITLKQRIGNDVLNEYLHLVTHYNVSAIEYENERKDQALFRAKGLTDLTYKLRDLTFKEKIVKECIVMFQDATFMSELDSNPYLLGFENGVYDLAEGVFRDGRPEDRVSLSTGIDFPDVELDLEDPVVLEILDFFQQVFPDEPLREYTLTLLASFLQGTNPDEKFHVFTGVGGNGKSKLMELFEMVMGEYAFKFPISLLTKGRAASGAANPEVARTRGKRFGCFQEPDEGERINVGLMKELTGGDKILVRALYSEPFEFKPQFKLVLCCNHLPKIPSDDEGTWRRMSVVEFLSRFVRNPDPSNRYEFSRDDTLSQKLIRWKEMFMVILVQYYKRYKIHGLVEPPEVKNATNEYKKDSDVYAQFRDDELVKDEYSILKLEESYAQFKVWYSLNVTSKAPTRREFKNNIERKLGVKYGRGVKIGWSGWKLNCVDEAALAESILRDGELDDELDESEDTGVTMTPDATKKTTIARHNPVKTQLASVPAPVSASPMPAPAATSVIPSKTKAMVQITPRSMIVVSAKKPVLVTPKNK